MLVMICRSFTYDHDSTKNLEPPNSSSASQSLVKSNCLGNIRNHGQWISGEKFQHNASKNKVELKSPLAKPIISSEFRENRASSLKCFCLTTRESKKQPWLARIHVRSLSSCARFAITGSVCKCRRLLSFAQEAARIPYCEGENPPAQPNFLPIDQLTVILSSGCFPPASSVPRICFILINVCPCQ